MKSSFFLILFSMFMVQDISCQNDKPTNEKIMNEIPYYEIPEAPETHTAATVLARTIDGLGYRYYWASEGLTEKDLAYEPGNEGRKSADVINHLYGLSKTILNAIKVQPNIRPAEKEDLTFEEKRKATLMNFKTASDLLRTDPDASPEKYKIIFQRGEKKSEFPFWNLLNGPVADAIYHTGQITSYRRSSGNPMNPNVNVFMGKNRE